MKSMRSLYGDSALHLLAVIASFAICGYAFFMIFQTSTAWGTVAWFAGAVIAHDLIAFPLYSGLNLIANRGMGSRSRSWVEDRKVQLINYIRIPAVVSAMLFLLFFPLIMRADADLYFANSGESVDKFLGRWLGICAVLFTISAITYAINLRRARSED